MAIGDDYDKSPEEKTERDSATEEQKKHIIVTSDGTAAGTKILTSDGVDLGSYGMIAASWQTGQLQCELTLVFWGPVIDIKVPMSATDILDTKCTCDSGWWAATQYDEVMKQFPSMLHAIMIVGDHHRNDCPRRKTQDAWEADFHSDEV